jgi:hypothetical protein
MRGQHSSCSLGLAPVMCFDRRIENVGHSLQKLPLGQALPAAEPPPSCDFFWSVRVVVECNVPGGVLYLLCRSLLLKLVRVGQTRQFVAILLSLGSLDVAAQVRAQTAVLRHSAGSAPPVYQVCTRRCCLRHAPCNLVWQRCATSEGRIILHVGGRTRHVHQRTASNVSCVPVQ